MFCPTEYKYIISSFYFKYNVMPSTKIKRYGPIDCLQQAHGHTPTYRNITYTYCSSVELLELLHTSLLSLRKSLKQSCKFPLTQISVEIILYIIFWLPSTRFRKLSYFVDLKHICLPPLGFISLFMYTLMIVCSPQPPVFSYSSYAFFRNFL